MVEGDGDSVWTALRLDEADNVATALRDLSAGAVPRIAGEVRVVLRDERTGRTAVETSGYDLRDGASSSACV